MSDGLVADFRQLAFQGRMDRGARFGGAARLDEIVGDHARIPKQRSARMHDEIGRYRHVGGGDALLEQRAPGYRSSDGRSRRYTASPADWASSAPRPAAWLPTRRGPPEWAETTPRPSAATLCSGCRNGHDVRSFQAAGRPELGRIISWGDRFPRPLLSGGFERYTLRYVHAEMWPSI